MPGTAFTCRIELNKEKGIIITVENKAGQITQTAVLDGTTMTLTCKGAEATSTITQKADSIVVKCKDFTVEAETVTVKSTKDTLHKSDAKLTVQSADDLEIKSDKKITATATADLKAAGSTFTADAQGAAKVSGATVDVTGQQQTAVAGVPLKLSSSMNVEVNGTIVKVASSGTLDLEGQVSTLKGQMTNVQGSLVKLG
jgi:hypothetical protein